MYSVTLDQPDDYEGWRDAARALAAAGVPAAQVSWQAGANGDLFAATQPLPTLGAPFSVPRRFLELAETVACHSDPERFALLYGFLLRLRDDPAALQDAADPLLRRLEGMAKAVRRDMHKMRAFLRFREVGTDERRFVAWFEPEHHIVRANAGFFVRRFASMPWSILTPELSLHWDGTSLAEGPGATRADAPGGDPTEDVWKTYYASVFNPARLKVGAMLKEMPRRYWKNMPETALVGQLIKGAQAREAKMVEQPARGSIGDNLGTAWASVRSEAMGCTRCHLYRCGTQTVFGEGPLDAKLMFVGEQPGDQEDLAGRPFVGPAGQLFDRALSEARVDRSAAYVTNAVKHFKFERRGKRRIHSKPDAGEIEACRWWLEQERLLLKPPIVVALGATAARSVFGKAVTIGAMRGRAHDVPGGGEAWVTVHPSFLLRVRDNREEEYARFVGDLRRIGERAAGMG
ncbi:MAG TPA: UdgX family uracil-DNA binding protein [Allosphingosinicella sp.]|nr:UdgX family uracil-DNA binding protein [Allosphingosinicella sp.]